MQNNKRPIKTHHINDLLSLNWSAASLTLNSQDAQMKRIPHCFQFVLLFNISSEPATNSSVVINIF